MKLSPLIVALDVENLKKAETLIQKLGPSVDFYKIGMKLFTRHGPDVLKLLRQKRKKIFLDLKFHDIPNTVAEACREATRHRVQMMTLHTSGGKEMMAAAVRAVRSEARRVKIPRPWVMGVTVLTSMDSLKELGIPRGVPEQVRHLARLAKASGLDGVICSPREIASVRKGLGKNFKIVTPGIRPAGAARGDQKRVMTPSQAFANGADALVVGRPIIQSRDPRRVVIDILQ